MVEEYFLTSRTIKAAVIIIDIRRGPEQEEIDLAGWLAGRSIRTLFVATKADKEKRSVLGARVRDSARVLGVSPDEFILFSAKTRAGRDLLWSRIREACNA